MCIRDRLSALSPICPFFSHYLSTTLYDSSAVDVRSFPRLPAIVDAEDAEGLRALTPIISEFNSMVWKLKKDSGLSLKSPISEIAVPHELSALQDSLIRMHSIE